MNPMENRQRLRQMIDGYRQTALIFAACKLGLPDLLATGPVGVSDLADRLAVNADALHRLLRGLEVLGIVRAEAGGTHALTELGVGLVSGAPGASAPAPLVAGEEYAPAWGALLHSVRTGEAAFDQVFGMDAWEHRQRHPEVGRAFQDWLREATDATIAGIVRACDFTDARVVADVGGGQGGLLAAILREHGHLSGLLIDQAQVVGQAGPALAAAGLGARCRLLAADFFEELPGGADLYLLKSILHDWDDARSVDILRTVRRALSPGARVLIIERPLPERACDAPATVMQDLHMLAVLGGRERAAGHYRELAAAAGLRWRRDLATDAGFVVMEFDRMEPAVARV